MKKYVCKLCGWVYDPAVGDPDNNVPAGTPFEKYLKAGYARYAEPERKSSKLKINPTTRLRIVRFAYRRISGW